MCVVVMRPHSHLSIRRSTRGLNGYPPDLLITLKFLASLSPWRAVADRGQDAVDLVRIYQALGEDLDRERALSRASTIFPGAERELEAILDRVDRGEKISI